MKFTRYTIQDPTNKHVLVGLGAWTRLDEADPGGMHGNPILFGDPGLAGACLEKRLGKDSRFQVVPVTITIGEEEPELHPGGCPDEGSQVGVCCDCKNEVPDPILGVFEQGYLDCRQTDGRIGCHCHHWWENPRLSLKAQAQAALDSLAERKGEDVGCWAKGLAERISKLED